MTRLDPLNPAVFDISQILAQKSIKNGFITEARDYMKVAHSMARDEETKFRLGKELEILEISADLYRKPTNEFEVVGKTLLEAELAPGEFLTIFGYILCPMNTVHITSVRS